MVFFWYWINLDHFNDGTFNLLKTQTQMSQVTTKILTLAKITLCQNFGARDEWILSNLFPIVPRGSIPAQDPVSLINCAPIFLWFYHVLCHPCLCYQCATVYRPILNTPSINVDFKRHPAISNISPTCHCTNTYCCLHLEKKVNSKDSWQTTR